MNTTPLKRDQAAVGDGDAMGVAGEVAQHVQRAAERWFQVDHPVYLLQFSQPVFEPDRVGELSQSAEKLQLAG